MRISGIFRRSGALPPIPRRIQRIWTCDSQKQSANASCSNAVRQEPNSPAILYTDLHLVHEVTSPQAFDGLRQRGLKVRRPDKTVATIDHAVPTLDGAGGRLAFGDEMALRQIRQL